MSRKVEVALTEHINIGNFSFVDVRVNVSQDFPVERPLSECIEELHAQIQATLSTQVDLLMAEAEAKTKNAK